MTMTINSANRKILFLITLVISYTCVTDALGQYIPLQPRYPQLILLSGATGSKTICHNIFQSFISQCIIKERVNLHLECHWR
jgi:hypothetical protein